MSGVAVTRPNGKVYRPRKGIGVAEFEDYDGCTNVVVVRTHDIETALVVAADRIAAYDLNPEKAHRVWWRLVPFDMAHTGYDSNWISDSVRGMPCVVIPYE